MKKRIDNPPPLLVEEAKDWKCPDCGSTEYRGTIQGRSMEIRIKDGRVEEFCVHEFDLWGEYVWCAKCKRDITEEASVYFSAKYGDSFVLKHVATERDD